MPLYGILLLHFPPTILEIIMRRRGKDYLGYLNLHQLQSREEKGRSEQIPHDKAGNSSLLASQKEHIRKIKRDTRTRVDQVKMRKIAEDNRWTG